MTSKIAVLGAGNVGGTLGKKWTSTGHQVVFGARDVSSPKVGALLEATGGKARGDTIPNAIAFGDVVLLAIPHGAVAGTVSANAAALAGKIVIDASNSFGAPVVNNVRTILDRVPSAIVYRAFNSLGWEIFAEPDFGDVTADHFYCGPDGETRPVIEGLIADVGLRPIWIGDLDLVQVADHVGSLWVTLAFRRGLGRGLALKLFTRE